MEKTVIIPSNMRVVFTASVPFSIGEVLDGISFWFANRRQVTVQPALHEREFVLSYEQEPSEYWEKGTQHEAVDNTPVDVPLSKRGSPTLQQQIRELIARELSTRAKQDGFETLAEADDFDIGEQELDDLLTAYEFKPMQDEGPLEVIDPETPAPSPVDKPEASTTQSKPAAPAT